MVKQIKDLQREYRNVKFNIQEPILDIGGGEGYFLESQGIKKATIIDATKNRNNLFNYINTDLTKKLPKITKKFNTIFIMETLEHIPNPLYLLGQVYDLLANDGRCYISIPYTPIGNGSEHVCRWTLKGITNQLNKLGFNVKVIERRRRFKNTAFYLPHCWLVLEIIKKDVSTNESNIKGYNLDVSLRLKVALGGKSE